jgi:hypothetical protein
MIKKIIIVGIILFCMLVSLPSTLGGKIDFPRENGPYTVFIGGVNTLESPQNPITIDSENSSYNVGPFCFKRYPNTLAFNICMHEGRGIVIINGTTQTIPDYLVGIEIRGFMGFHVGTLAMMSKILLFGGIEPLYAKFVRYRTFGICDEIDFMWT